jgi:hypothetical protein
MGRTTFAAPLVATALATFGLAGTGHAQDLFLDGDIVRGAQEGAPGPVCVLNNQFKHLEKVVFRFRVRDREGRLLDNKDLKSLVVELADGHKVEGYYGGHPPKNAANPGGPTDYFWVAVWIIPASYPNGTFRYKATATDMAGHTQAWEPLVRVTSELQVLPGEIAFAKP